MDISGVSIPAIPEVQQQPPRDAVVQTAVKEASQTEAENHDSKGGASSSDSHQQSRESYSNLGRVVDERA